MSVRLTPAQTRLLREVVTGRSAHRQAPPHSRCRAIIDGVPRDVTRQAEVLRRYGLIRVEPGVNGWRYALVATSAGRDALADNKPSGKDT